MSASLPRLLLRRDKGSGFKAAQLPAAQPHRYHVHKIEGLALEGTWLRAEDVCYCCCCCIGFRVYGNRVTRLQRNRTDTTCVHRLRV